MPLLLMAVNVCLVAMQFQWGGRMYGVSGSDRYTTVKEGSDQVRPYTTGGALSEEVPEGDEHIAARAVCVIVPQLACLAEERAVAMQASGHGRMRRLK
jgi:hypothetical protein